MSQTSDITNLLLLNTHVIGVGFRCHPLVTAGKVSAAKVTDQKCDNFGLTVTSFKGYVSNCLVPSRRKVWISRSTKTASVIETPLQMPGKTHAPTQAIL